MFSWAFVSVYEFYYMYLSWLRWRPNHYFNFFSRRRDILPTLGLLTWPIYDLLLTSPCLFRSPNLVCWITSNEKWANKLTCYNPLYLSTVSSLLDRIRKIMTSDEKPRDPYDDNTDAAFYRLPAGFRRAKKQIDKEEDGERTTFFSLKCRFIHYLFWFQVLKGFSDEVM